MKCPAYHFCPTQSPMAIPCAQGSAVLKTSQVIPFGPPLPWFPGRPLAPCCPRRPGLPGAPRIPVSPGSPRTKIVSPGGPGFPG